MSEGGGEKNKWNYFVKIKLYIPSMYTLFRALLKTWEKKSHLFIITNHDTISWILLFSSDDCHIITKKFKTNIHEENLSKETKQLCKNMYLKNKL